MKHVPQRTCIACRSAGSKRELVRVVRHPDGSVVVDESGKANGRGAYLCRDPKCWASALAGRGPRAAGKLAAALKTSLSDSDRDALRAYAKNLVQATPVSSQEK